ncbi:Eco57I restriction-modification methylase domain-containing protein [Melioribacter sp. OK-6-Me]|uniref:Eco57I restriction-modification methylase domain-containing protein n=1 Tax=unclassified Melioribacter TaxID=2627329 RepID=UPI003ED92FB3
MSIKEIISNLTTNFDPEYIVHLLREKARTFRQINRSLPQYNDENFIDCLHLGEFTLENHDKMIVVTVKVSKELSERSGKKAQYALGKKILKNLNSYIGGFFIFYDDKSDFRFSLIYAIPLATGKRDWNNFKRYTYFVSKEQANKTFINQITSADFSTLDKIIDAFSVEKVTKEFYTEIANWFFWAMDLVEFPDDEDKDRENRNAKSLIRLITRMIFIWFMKEKRLIPPSLFEKSVIDEIINYKDKTGSTYYKAILQNLFFATLNTKMKSDDPNSRIFVDEAEKRGFVSDAYLEQGYYRYKRFIKNKELFLKQFEKVPFLNGGLFESLDKKVDGKEIRIDCFSDNPKNETRLKVPDELFFLETEREINLSNYIEKANNKKVKGLFSIFKQYNFTIDENTPVDQDVALDPELLGKVFENLLAAYVPETATTARKSTGSYYTPREIVEYMVDESLIAYLKNKVIERAKSYLPLGTDQADMFGNSVIVGQLKLEEELLRGRWINKEEQFTAELKKLFSYDDTQPEFTAEEKEFLIDAIENLKVLDPACGSGAFPMGVLHKLVLALHKLDPQNEIWKKKMLEKVPAEIRHETEVSLQNKSIDYIRKLGLIENCIYGVDIQEIAIQISKLRFFISLLVEQEIDDTKENRDIRALPNLETKFVAANTLIGLERSEQMKLTSNEIEKLEKNLFKVREEIFYTNSRKEKYELQKKERQLRAELKIALEHNGFPNDITEKITKWDPFDQNTHADWFDPEWMFGVKVYTEQDRSEGFYIVIGNPPYVQLQKSISDKSKLKYADLYKNQNYKTFDRTGDIYCLFYEKGINLLKESGFLCYITSNKWMRAGYGEVLRKFFSRLNPILLIDLGPGVFENATVDTNILLIQKANNDNKLLAVTLQKENNNADIAKQLNERGVILNKLTKDAWFIGNSAEQRLKEKIERKGKPLRDWDVNIYRGIVTGLNEAFIITTEKRNEILDNCKDVAERERTEAIIKPILRGRDIKRYYYEWAGLWVIIAKYNSYKIIPNEYPAIYNHLKKFEIQLKDRGQCRYSRNEKQKNQDFPGQHHWLELDNNPNDEYLGKFEKEKVVWKRIGSVIRFSYDNKSMYTIDSNVIMTGKNIKFLCGYLNSRLSIKQLLENSPKTGTGDVIISVQALEPHKIPSITASNQPIVSQIEALVDKILQAKKANPNTDTTAWEREIDQLVYRLYDLTEEEIKIIEKK